MRPTAGTMKEALGETFASFPSVDPQICEVSISSSSVYGMVAMDDMIVDSC